MSAPLRRGPFFVPSTFPTFVRTVEVDIITMVRYRRLSANGSVNESNKAPFPINTQAHLFWRYLLRTVFSSR